MEGRRRRISQKESALYKSASQLQQCEDTLEINPLFRQALAVASGPHNYMHVSFDTSRQIGEGGNAGEA